MMATTHDLGDFPSGIPQDGTLKDNHETYWSK